MKEDVIPMARLDPAQFAQIHRSVVVNLRAIDRIMRGDNETAEVHLKGRGDVLPVSRSASGIDLRHAPISFRRENLFR